MEHVTKAVTINRPRAEVFAFWRNFANLPGFMYHVARVDVTGPNRSHWVVKGPAGSTVEWDAEIVHEQAGELISWRSLEGSGIENAGTVRFVDAPAGRGTEVQVELSYSPPGGAVGVTLAKWFGEEPQQQLTDDLRRFKQVMETGEVVLSDGSPEGAGEGATNERPAQASGAEVRS